jgi:hypothetical protein
MAGMADNKTKIKSGAGGDSVAGSVAGLLTVTGSVDKNLGRALLLQTVRTFLAAGDLTQEQQTKAVEMAVAALKGLAPQGELEGMLAVQMVATHNAAMECLRLGMIAGQSFEWREQNLKHAAKLLVVYARQVEALDRHRGKGQQTITVEHVTVNAGGQAIVGNVEAGARGATASGGAAVSAECAALTHNPAPLAPQLDVASLAKTKQKTPVR